MEFWRKSSAITLVQMCEKSCVTIRARQLDLVNMKAYIKFGEILSTCSQNIEQKQNFVVNQMP